MSTRPSITFTLFLGLPVIFLTIPTPLFSQYARVYGGASNERAYALSEGLNSSTNIAEYVIAGWTESFNPRRNPLIIGVTKSNGNFSWGLLANDTGEFRSIVKTGDGYVLTGYLNQLGGNTRSDVIVAKANFSGQFQWRKIYRAPLDDIGHSIIKTQDNGFAVCGWTFSFGPDPKPNILVLKLDSLGNLQWSRVIWFVSLYAIDQGFGIIELPYLPNYPTMRYAIVGRTSELNDTFNYDAFVMTLDIFGTPMWKRVIPGIRDDEAYSVIISNDTLTVAGWTNSFSPDSVYADIFLWNMWVYNGAPIWLQTYGHTGFDDKVGDDNCLTLNSATSSYPYRYLVSGWTKHTPGPTGSTDFLYLSVLPNGTLHWAKRHPSSETGTLH